MPTSAHFVFDGEDKIGSLGELVKWSRKRDQENGRTELYATKLQKVIEALTPSSLEEIGSTSWMKKVNALVMVRNAMDDSPDNCIELLLKFNKTKVIVHDMLLMDIWIQEILPQIVEASKNRPTADGDGICGNTTDILTLHSRNCSSLVNALLKYPSYVDVVGLQSDILDIIDHAICILQNFIAKKPDHDPNLSSPDGESEATNEKGQLSYDRMYEIAYMNLENLFCLALHLFDLPPFTLAKLLHPSTRLMITMVDLIVSRPWCYMKPGSKGYGFLRWTPPTLNSPARSPNALIVGTSGSAGALVPFDPIETMSWQILKELLVVKHEAGGRGRKMNVAFDIDKECCDKLLLLQEPLKVKSFVKKMPGIYDLKLLLARTKPTPTDTAETFENPLDPVTFTIAIKMDKPPPPSPYHESIRAELLEKKDAILRIHEAMGTFEIRTGEDARTRQKRTLTLDVLYKDLNNYCFKCGKADAPLRCSRCHFAYYCDRKCQSKNWKEHKPECRNGFIRGMKYVVGSRDEHETEADKNNEAQLIEPR